VAGAELVVARVEETAAVKVAVRVAAKVVG
jgi:hypothetical protein